MESNLQLGKAFLAMAVFLAFLAWDVVKAFKRGDKWIQGSALTLTALTVLFLGYFDVQNVNPFGESIEQELQMLLNKQFSVDMARLVFCTFLGCVLPGVAFHGSEGRWSSIAAVAVSLCMHMATEVYVLQNVDNRTVRNEGRTMFISSSVLLLMAAISLVLYIGLAVINCKLTRDRLSIKIPQMLSRPVQSEMLDGNEGEVFKWWAIVRGCQQEFWLVSSAFTPAVLMIVTTCVAVVVGKLISRQSLLHRGDNTLTWTLCLQCVFILEGWIILIWRWAIFLTLCVSRKSDFFDYINYTGICETRFCRLVYLFVRRALNLSPLDNVSYFKCIPTNMWEGLKNLVCLIFLIAMLPMGLFIIVICFLLLVNFFCWGLSILLVWSVIKVAHAIGCIDILKVLVSDAEVELKTGTREILYVANSSIKQTKCRMKDAYAMEEKYQKIVKVINQSVKESREVTVNWLSHTETEYVYEHQGVWKMAAVAAISILAELEYSQNSNEKVKDSVQAYKEAKDLLEFLDFPDNITANPMNLFDSGNSRAYQMSLEADIKMQKIQKLVEIKARRHGALTLEDVAEVVEKFAGKPARLNDRNKKFYQDWSGQKGFDSLGYGEGTDLVKRFSMKGVCQAVLKESLNQDKNLVDKAARCLGDIIACAVLQLQLPEVLPRYCRKWAEEFKEENLIKALEIQEKLRAIKENWLSAESAAAREAKENKSAEFTMVNVQETEKDNRCEISDVQP